MKIGILQTGHAVPEVRAERGEYADIFEKLLQGHGFTFDHYMVVDGEFPDGPEAADGWLITGSKHGAYENLPWIGRLETLIRQIRDSRRPLIGVCFGHQIIAQALGGKVEKFAGGWAVGPQEYRFENGEKLRLNAWHQDQVTQLPEGAKVLASNDFCENASLLIGDRILTIQPHPEFDAWLVETLINTRGRGVVPDDLLEHALAALPASIDSQAYAGQMADFFKSPYKPPHKSPDKSPHEEAQNG